MPTTRQLVSLIKEEYLPKWSRTRILYYLDWAQRELFKTDCDQHKFYNFDDPEFPYCYLQTTANKLRYNINDTNLLDSNGDVVPLTLNGVSTTARRVDRVFISVTTLEGSEYDRRWYGEEFTLVGLNDFYSRRLYNVYFYEVPLILRDQTDTGEPYLVFAEDPENQTSRFYIDLYLNPPPLESEDTKMHIDSDKWELELISAVVGRAEDVKNGRSQKLREFMDSFKKKYKNSMSELTDKRTPDQFTTREAG